MIRGIVFDKDGTLLLYEPFWVPVAEAAMRTLLASRCTDKDDADKLYDELLTAIGAGDGIMGVLCHGTYGDIAAAIEPVCARLLPSARPVTTGDVEAAFEASLNAGVAVPVCDDLPGVLHALKTRGLTIGLVTSDNRPITEYCLTLLGILPCFDIIRVDDGITPPKPHPDHMHAFCEAAGLRPDEVIMVGDTASDMRFAHASGAHPVAVAKEAADAAVLSPLAEAVLSDVSALPAYLDKLGDRL